MLYALLFVLTLSEVNETRDEVNEILKMKPDVAIAHVESKGTSAYDYGMDLLGLGHIDDALRYFDYLSSEVKGEGRFPLLYGKAWLHFVKNDLDKAVRHADYILFNSDDQLLAARSFYLIGMIHQIWGENETSLINTRKALEAYRALGKKGGIQRCYARLSNIYYGMGDDARAERFLGLAKSIKSERSQARLVDIEASKAFNAREYSKAILANMKGIEAWEDVSQINVIWYTARIGFCYAMLGDYNKAYDYAAEVDRSHITKQMEDLYFFNNFTWMILSQCRNYSTKEMKAKFEEWSDKKRFKYLIDEIENAKCDDSP